MTLPELWDATPDAPLAPRPTTARTPLLDGTHRGVRWWVERVDGHAAPLVTLACADPAVQHQVEMPGCTRRMVEALVEGELARVAAGVAKRRRVVA